MQDLLQTLPTKPNAGAIRPIVYCTNLARSPSSMERRRSWAAAGRLPPALAARFTIGETAVLAVIAAEMAKRGAYTLAIDHIAALAGVCATTAKNALRAAHGLGLIRIEERRLTAWRNLPNLVTITSPEWLSWLRIGPKGEGANLCPAHVQILRNGLTQKRENIMLGAISGNDRAQRKSKKGYRHSWGFCGECGVRFLSRERAIMDDWYPVRLASRDGTPVILWIEDEEAPPTFPVTVGV